MKGFPHVNKVMAGIVVLISVLIYQLLFILDVMKEQSNDDPFKIDLGREVYISEGCIHCHSQFIRPVNNDQLYWGEARSEKSVLSDEPVLIGNRRQGPDLTNLAIRRNREWNRLHLIDPQTVSPGSRMPSYAWLFPENGDQSRGNALLDYLESLGTELNANDRDKIMQTRLEWAENLDFSNYEPDMAVEAYDNLCTQCHGVNGRGDGPLSRSLVRHPRNFVNGSMLYSPEKDREVEAVRKSRALIIKYGLEGSSMPGHETLPDQAIVNLVRFLEHFRSISQSEP